MILALVCLLIAVVGIPTILLWRARSRGLSWGLYSKAALFGFCVVVASLIIYAASPDISGLLAWFWVLPALGLLLATILIAVEWPDNSVGNYLDRLAWGPLTDPTDPTSAPVRKYPPANVAQAICAAVMLVAMVLAWVIIGIHGFFVPPGTTHAAPKPTNTVAPTTKGPAAPAGTPTTKASPVPSSTPGVCGVSELYQVASPGETRFHPGGVEVCTDGKWVAWSGPAPSDVTVTYAASADPYNVYLFTWKGKQYVVRAKIDN